MLSDFSGFATSARDRIGFFNDILIYIKSTFRFSFRISKFLKTQFILLDFVFILSLYVESWTLTESQ